MNNKTRRAYMYGALFVCFLAAVDATIAAKAQRWDMWALNGLTLAIAGATCVRAATLRSR